jgi:hypothetical protein
MPAPNKRDLARSNYDDILREAILDELLGIKKDIDRKQKLLHRVAAVLRHIPIQGLASADVAELQEVRLLLERET